MNKGMVKLVCKEDDYGEEAIKAHI